MKNTHCPICDGNVGLHRDEDCHGCHYLQCDGCKAMFDLSLTVDPNNEIASLEELQGRIVEAWDGAKCHAHRASSLGEYIDQTRLIDEAVPVPEELIERMEAIKEKAEAVRKENVSVPLTLLQTILSAHEFSTVDWQAMRDLREIVRHHVSKGSPVKLAVQ